MNKLYRLRSRVMAFMQGRNGVDQIVKACLGAYFLLYIVNIFARSLIISLIMTALFVYMILRIMSRIVDKRFEENARFLMLIGRIKRKYSMTKTMLTDKTRVYKKCPGCKSIMRIQRIPGRHTVKCPCGRQLEINIRGKKREDR